MAVDWQALGMVPILIGMNAFFVVSEYAVVATRPAQIAAMRASGALRAAAAMSRLKDSPASAIGAIQVCITMTNLLLGWIGEPAMSELIRTLFQPMVAVLPAAVFTAISTGLSFILVTLLTVVFSELLPKALTLRFVDLAARWTAVAVLTIQRAIFPLVWIMNTTANAVTRPLGLGRVEDFENQQVTIDELRLIANQAAADGVVTPRERTLVLNTLAMGLRSARQIMVPRVKVAFLDVRRSMDENLEVSNQFLFSRLPLCDGGLDHVIGVVRTNEFLSAYYAAGDSSMLPLLARPPVFVPESITLDRLLEVFHDRKTQLTFLVDEYGGVEGIVTLQDVVDELLGESAAPNATSRGEVTPAESSDAVPDADLHAGEFAIAGDAPIHDLAHRLGRDKWGAGASAVTIGGLLTTHFQQVPRPGDEAVIDGVSLRVLSADRRSVKRVAVLRPDASPPSPKHV
jgi:CBS domain containing-hemolysin-like protein